MILIYISGHQCDVPRLSSDLCPVKNDVTNKNAEICNLDLTITKYFTKKETQNIASLPGRVP
jgi:hypothetical protein